MYLKDDQPTDVVIEDYSKEEEELAWMEAVEQPTPSDIWIS